MKRFFRKILELFLGLLFIFIILIIYDRFCSEKLPFISVKNIEQIKKAKYVFIGSSHTQFHIIPDTLEKYLGGEKVAILASGGSYLVDNIYLINILNEKHILDNKYVFAQFELSGSFENHPYKSYYALNLPFYIYKIILLNSTWNELRIFLTSVFIDIFFIEDFHPKPIVGFNFKKCEDVRIKKHFPMDKFRQNYFYKNGNNFGDSYSKFIIGEFNRRMKSEKNMNYTNYIAAGSNLGNYDIESVIDLRWNKEYLDSAFWWDSNHLTFVGAVFNTKMVANKLINNVNY
jgi:hypothetical protein